MLDRQADPQHPPAVRPAPDEADRRGPAPDRTIPAGDLAPVRAVIEGLPEAVFITESDGELRLTNPAADRMFADRPVLDRADLLSRFEDVAPKARGGSRPKAVEDDQQQWTVRPRHQPNRWFALRTVDLSAVGGIAADDSAGARASGGPSESSWAQPDRPPETVFILRDITDSRDLQPLREAFLAILSHELRTPITTIYAGSSVLARRRGLSPPATETLVRDISAEAARLYDLVEDLLVLARVERGVLDPLDEPVLIRRIVDTTIRTIHDRFGEAPVVIRSDPNIPPVHGDATYVEQAFRDLILAAMPDVGSVAPSSLEIAVDFDPDADEVRVTVTDRGPTIPAELLERAFELPEAGIAGRPAGAGIGPFVCRNLIEAMGGRVWAVNRPGGGLELGFALRADQRD